MLLVDDSLEPGIASELLGNLLEDFAFAVRRDIDQEGYQPPRVWVEQVDIGDAKEADEPLEPIADHRPRDDDVRLAHELPMMHGLPWLIVYEDREGRQDRYG